MKPRRASREPGAPPVLLFDGVCGVCNAGVDFLLGRDARGGLRFAALRSVAGTALLRRFGMPAGYVDSLAFCDLQRGRMLLRSAGVAAALREIAPPWPLVAALMAAAPAGLADLGYAAVAALRSRVVPRRATCRGPALAERARFLP